jgi:hypothetical protein
MTVQLSSQPQVDKEKAKKLDPKILRELQLYNQTLSGVQQAIQDLKKEGLPIFRPDDFYAETIKSDKQVLKIHD